MSFLSAVFRPRLLLTGLALASTSAAQAQFTGLGMLPGGAWSYAYGVSADGSVVVGGADDGGGYTRAFRWEGGTMSDLGTLGGNSSEAAGVSADGSVVVGNAATSTISQHAFRWEGGLMSDLGDLDGGSGSSWARGVSADGGVVVGGSATGTSYSHAFRWEGGIMSDLGTLGGSSSEASGVSANGSVVVGWATINAMDYHAFRWEGGTMSDLGTLGGSLSEATGVSANGSVVVGWAMDNDHNLHAFRWESGLMSDLGTLGGTTYSRARGVSADGNVVVGQSTTITTSSESFRWTQAGGMQSVVDWLASAGVSVPTNYSLIDAYATNADGSVVVGEAYNSVTSDSEAWLARVSTTHGSGIINPLEYNHSITEAASRAVQAGIQLSAMAMFGAHHRSLLDSGLARGDNGVCAWGTVDTGRFNTTDTRMSLTEAGACMDFGSLRAGLGVGKAWARQNWKLGGKADFDGHYLVAELANDFGNQLEGSITGYYGRFDAKLRRHYRNGASIDSSRGNPDARSYAIRAQLDWKNAFAAGAFAFTPYAAYTHIRTRLDSYTEHGGGFPARFESTSWRTNDIRAGLAATTELSDATSLRLGAEAVHRFDGSTNGAKGQVLGLWDFDLSGQSVRQNWVRGLIDLDHRFARNHLGTVGFNLASKGGDPSWAVTLGYRGSF